AGAGVPGPPRDLERELRLPPVGRPAVPGEGSQPQQPRLGDPGDGRGLAQQPPRLPDLGPARAAVVADRRRLLRHPAAGTPPVGSEGPAAGAPNRDRVILPPPTE